MLVLKHRGRCLPKGGEYVTRSIDVTSARSSFLTAGHETKKLSEFHQISKLWDSQPRVAKPTAKYHIRVVFSIKLLLKLIWLKVSSAFNLGQRQQWNFPSLSCGA